jgi:predicted DNA-binding transcriptional regulator AlpA
VTTTHPAAQPERRGYLSPEQVSEWTQISVAALGQLRYTGRGPKFLKPTPKTVLYRESDVQAWLDASERTSTARAS